MSALISDLVDLELTPEVANAVEALTAEIDSVAILESIQARESTLTKVMEEILQFQPTSGCGVND